MKNWTELQIGIVYYSGLLISILAGAMGVLYLDPVKNILNKFALKFVGLWSNGFKSSIILAGLLGAMSVSFKDCSGKYDYLLDSPQNTILKGCEQVSKAFEYVALVLGLWLIVFILLRFTMIKKNA
jgi:hypothetical protein